MASTFLLIQEPVTTPKDIFLFPMLFRKFVTNRIPIPQNPKQLLPSCPFDHIIKCQTDIGYIEKYNDEHNYIIYVTLKKIEIEEQVNDMLSTGIVQRSS